MNVWKEIDESRSLEFLNGSLVEHFGPYVQPLDESEEAGLFYGEKEFNFDYEQFEIKATDVPALRCAKYVILKLNGQEYGESLNLKMPTNGILSIGAFQQMLMENDCIVEEQYDTSLEELAEMLSTGDCVVCYVSTVALDHPDFLLSPLETGDCLVAVTGLDLSNPGNIQVILIRFDTMDGFSMAYGWNHFLRAWKSSGRYCLVMGGR